MRIAPLTLTSIPSHLKPPGMQNDANGRSDETDISGGPAASPQLAGTVLLCPQSPSPIATSALS